METDEQRLPTLLRNAGRDAMTLVRQESQLLQTEVGLRVDRLERALVFATIGAAAGVLCGLCAAATLILGLAVVMPAWAAALVVTLGMGAAAGGGLLLAKRRLDSGLAPEETEESVRQDVHALKEAM